jgi:hypothetical protein
MKTASIVRKTAILFSLLLLSLSCNLLVGASPQQQQDLPTQETIVQTQPEATDTNQPEATNTALPLSPVPPSETAQSSNASSTTPSCTILTNLFFRSGPGVEYPEIDAFTANTTITPVGYNPSGWIYAQNPANQEFGWVAENPNYVSCNLDPKSLPSKAADAPPPTAVRIVLPHSALGTPTDQGGTCGPGLPYDCNVIMSEDTLLQFKLLKDGVELTDPAVVQQVDFFVFDNDQTRTIYAHTERNSPYCIFGGDSNCNPWVFEDGVYKWESGGEVVQAGTYVISITPLLANGDNVHWEWHLEISLP